MFGKNSILTKQALPNAIVILCLALTLLSVLFFYGCCEQPAPAKKVY